MRRLSRVCTYGLSAEAEDISFVDEPPHHRGIRTGGVGSVTFDIGVRLHVFL